MNIDPADGGSDLSAPGYESKGIGWPMKRYLPFFIIGAVALATAGGGAILYRAMRPHPLNAPHATTVQPEENAAITHIRGNPKAPVTLEEFGDLECGPCHFVAPFLDELVVEYQPRLRLVFRHFPLESHKHAQEAARAAEAAGLQGKFWEMHDLLYREQSAWTKASNVTESFDRYATRLGLDLARFQKDMAGEKVKGAIAADVSRGKSMGVNATPTFFVDHRGLSPDERSPNGLRAAIDAELKATKAH